jgi:hypothetical protein
MTPEQYAALRKPFDPKAIGKLPKGGVQLDFVGHAAVTDRLLAVDPDWTWEPFAVGADGLPAYQNNGLWIRLTICGVTRIGFGDGPDPKQRIGDAIRNAAMRFGVALDLWSRQELEGIDPNGGDAATRMTAEQFNQKHHEPAAGSSTPPVVNAPAAPIPSLESAQQEATDPAVVVEAIRTSVLEAMKLNRTEALRLITRANMDAAKAKVMKAQTHTPEGDMVTLDVFLDLAMKHATKKAA